MTQLVKQRPLAVWCLFLAGAVTGGLASSLMGPQQLLADPVDLNGQKFEQLQQLVAAHNQLLEGISRDESGGFFFHEPVTVQCALDAESPTLSVCGPALFESAVAPSYVLLNDHGPEYPEPDFSGPAFQTVGDAHVFGHAAIILPEDDPGLIPALDVRAGGNWDTETPDSVLARFRGPTEWTGPDLNLRSRMAADEFAMQNDGLGWKTCLNSVEVLLKSGAPGAARFGIDPETGGTEISVDSVETDSLTAFEANIFNGNIVNLTEGEKPGPF